jgi:hypothetical protein
LIVDCLRLLLATQLLPLVCRRRLVIAFGATATDAATVLEFELGKRDQLFDEFFIKFASLATKTQP